MDAEEEQKQRKIVASNLTSAAWAPTSQSCKSVTEGSINYIEDLNHPQLLMKRRSSLTDADEAVAQFLR